MRQESSSSRGIAILGVLLTCIGILWGFYEFHKNNQDTQGQVAYEKTKIALVVEQNQLQSQELTSVAQQLNVEKQLLTLFSTESGDFSLTATALMVEYAQIEVTNQAIAAKQEEIKVAQTSVALLQPTLAMELIADLKIYGNDASGKTWCASNDGTYSISYSSGAYSGWPEPRQSECAAVGCWITVIRAYLNREIEWVSDGNVEGPENADFEFDTKSKHSSIEDAEERARLLSSILINLRQDDCITLVATDAKESYVGNPGYVDLKISYLPP